MSDEPYDLRLCVHCGQSLDEHKEPTGESAWLRFCQDGGAAYWSRHKERASERERRWKFVTEAAIATFRANGASPHSISIAWDALVADERRWLLEWRHRA